MKSNKLSALLGAMILAYGAAAHADREIGRPNAPIAAQPGPIAVEKGAIAALEPMPTSYKPGEPVVFRVKGSGGFCPMEVTYGDGQVETRKNANLKDMQSVTFSHTYGANAPATITASVKGLAGCDGQIGWLIHRAQQTAGGMPGQIRVQGR